MFLDRRVAAKEPLSRVPKRDGRMKVPSVVGRNWWRVRVLVMSIRALEGIERRRASFSVDGRERGMERAVRSSLNWAWVSLGCFGCTAGLLDQMQTFWIRVFVGGWRRS